jgi:hypothetical protein
MVLRLLPTRRWSRTTNAIRNQSQQQILRKSTAGKSARHELFQIRPFTYLRANPFFRAASIVVVVNLNLS